MCSDISADPPPTVLPVQETTAGILLLKSTWPHRCRMTCISYLRGALLARQDWGTDMGHGAACLCSRSIATTGSGWHAMWHSQRARGQLRMLRNRRSYMMLSCPPSFRNCCSLETGSTAML